MSLWRYANPAEFMRVSGAALPWLAGLTAAALAVGLGWGFFLTPEDYQQGSTVKILFVHVPAALMAINAWLMMLVASLIWFIRRHHVLAPTGSSRLAKYQPVMPAASQRSLAAPPP
jgi:heme exporter protein C